MVSILCIGTLNAQTSDEGTSAGIEEVVVTAQKREGTLQETPIAITAVTSDEINYKNVNTIKETTSSLFHINHLIYLNFIE